MIHFILGGARSGKSSFAENQSLSFALNNKNEVSLTYVATATKTDNEMTRRIQRHQQDRDPRWQLMECPIMLAEMVTKANAKEGEASLYLIDCLTLWLNNLLFALDNETEQKTDELLSQYVQQFITALSASKATFFIVSNEVGLGVIPMGSTTRLFVDHCGWLNQKVAAIADKVTLVMAGIPMTLKSTNAKEIKSCVEKKND